MSVHDWVPIIFKTALEKSVGGDVVVFTATTITLAFMFMGYSIHDAVYNAKTALNSRIDASIQAVRNSLLGGRLQAAAAVVAM